MTQGGHRLALIVASSKFTDATLRQLVTPGQDATDLARVLAARQATVADVGVGVGPIVIPEDSTPDNPYGVIDVAANVYGRETCRRLRASGDRARARQWAADSVLAVVRECVLA